MNSKKRESPDLQLLPDVIAYYNTKLAAHGPTHRGVDWSSAESQELRYEKLGLLLAGHSVNTQNHTVLDYGCGYGGFFVFLRNRYLSFNFDGTGFDLSLEMLAEAKNIYPEASWVQEIAPNKSFDYSFASGVFNVKLEIPDNKWENFIFDSIEDLNSISNKGFAFNLLSSHSDIEKRASHLFYADPAKIFTWCKKNISKYVSLIHDYPLFEFTILIRK